VKFPKLAILVGVVSPVGR